MIDTLEKQQLQNEINRLKNEVLRLRNILERAGISYEQTIATESENQNQHKEPIDLSTTNDLIKLPIIGREHALILYSIFKGRKDVYSKRGLRKGGGSSYYTQCDNFWRSGVCAKREGTKIKCMNCPGRSWSKLTQRVLINHLRGDSPDGTDVIGIYPLLPDNTCNFLVFDFDNHDSDLTNNNDSNEQDYDWKDEVNALRSICVQQGFIPLVERSRSGSGAHIWLFFEEPIPASLARIFGSSLLTIGSETINLKSFKSYDRMLPAQDKIPAGGLGNLIALPLQGLALRHGNSAFIDESWHAYENQWLQLQNICRISRSQIEEKLKEWNLETEPLGALSVIEDGESKYSNTPGTKNNLGFDSGSDNDSGKNKPWQSKNLKLTADMLSGKLIITLANGIFIETSNLKPAAKNILRRMGAFSNPLFYKKQAMGYDVRGISRIIWCGNEEDGYIKVPRGKLENLMENIQNENIPHYINDIRSKGKIIKVLFNGELYPEQKKAADNILSCETGILSATTAFGKTAVGSYIIAEKKLNTLIIVHNREIMNNWIEDLKKFLTVDEELPQYQTPTGRTKTRKSFVGTLYAGHNTMGGIIDIAMIASLGASDELMEKQISSYGLVIMDECHHAGAVNAETVLNKIHAKYVYGLTATPKRDDGMEQKVYMQFGPIRWKYTSKERIVQEGFNCLVKTRFTSLINAGKPWLIHEAYHAAIHDGNRNKQIEEDVRACIANGHTPLLLTKFREHAELLTKQLKDSADHVFLLYGGRNNKERITIRNEMNHIPSNESILLIATGQYIGEGFNLPRLDTLFLASPIAWEGNLEQYAGRLHRTYLGKTQLTIYDYIDSHVRVFDRMFRKRLNSYKKIGYSISDEQECPNTKTNNSQGFYDWQEINRSFWADAIIANEELIISSPGINKESVFKLLDIMPNLLRKNIRISVYTLSPEQYPDSQKKTTEVLIRAMEDNGVWVILIPNLHEHFAVIDQQTVWYGSANLLSRLHEDDGMLRLNDISIALNILEYLTDGRPSYLHR